MKRSLMIYPVQNGWVVEDMQVRRDPLNCNVVSTNGVADGKWVFNSIQDMVAGLPMIVDTNFSPSTEESTPRVYSAITQ